MSTVSVIAPLHSDETKASCRHIPADEIGRYVDGLGNLLGEQLFAAAQNEWPALKMLYVDCMLTDFDGRDVQEFKFHRKTGQFNINCAINCERLFGSDLETQATLTFQAILQSAEQAFSQRGHSELLLATQAFAERVSPSWIRSVAHTQAFARDEQDSGLPSPELPKDPDGRIRILMEIPSKRGELWVMLKAGEQHDDDLAHEIVEAIQCHVLSDSSARLDGRSFGEHSCDVSFKVRNLKATGERLDEYLRGTFPEIDYVISDDYEVAFSTNAA